VEARSFCRLCEWVVGSVAAGTAVDTQWVKNALLPSRFVSLAEEARWIDFLLANRNNLFEIGSGSTQAPKRSNSNYVNIGVGAGAAATILSIYHDLASAALALAGDRSWKRVSSLRPGMAQPAAKNGYPNGRPAMIHKFGDLPLFHSCNLALL
jgi:hypothetical protein